jgi:hypothetical protein
MARVIYAVCSVSCINKYNTDVGVVAGSRRKLFITYFIFTPMIFFSPTLVSVVIKFSFLVAIAVFVYSHMADIKSRFYDTIYLLLCFRNLKADY